MLKVVENEAAIARYQQRFARSLRSFADEKILVKLGHPGASEKAKVAWSESLRIWFFSRRIVGSRYWNAFGIGRPENGESVAITCEINIPVSGIDRRIGGAFAEDQAGRILVVHRGKLGGGRKGVGKSLFEERYSGVWEVMDDGGEETPVAVAGVLQSPRLPRQIAQFVRKIARIKESATLRSSQGELTFDEISIHEELIGERCREQERETGAECDRGLIVRDLADALKKTDFRMGNDGHRDLMVIDRQGGVRAVFQVRTETTLSGLHAGATQLLLNGLSLPGSPLLVLVLPRMPEGILGDKLKRLNINLLVYEWEQDRAVFPELEALLTRLA